MTGLVLKSTGSWYEVLAEDGNRYQCRVRGKLRIRDTKTTNPVAVGDQVELDPEDTSQAIITDVLPRENYIIRQSVHKKGHAHILASNLDQAVLIVTLSYPRTSLGFIDRFLVSAESFRIPQVLIFNKVDLLNEKEKRKMEHFIEMYEKIGVKCLRTSAKSQEGIEQFRAILAHKKSLIAGHSGVGKSTLINLLSPEIEQKTGEVSDFANKGIHTTTFAEMFQLENETFIIDTPGIKELALVEIPPEELGDYFPEIRVLRGSCKFNNCLHLREPGCAVKQALEDGDINPLRFKSYLSMLDGDED
ncbi:ribosome small subunit-dependent GTPase A [Fulvivirga sedimenti]|nr:ribosome small subunit-dependent GTPase A [Fulvivirga sedimenti]